MGHGVKRGKADADMAATGRLLYEAWKEWNTEQDKRGLQLPINITKTVEGRIEILK